MKCMSCGSSCRTPKAPNWKLWQLCYKCALVLHPDYYKDKHRHGTGGTWLNDLAYEPMIAPEIKNT